MRTSHMRGERRSHNVFDHILYTQAMTDDSFSHHTTSPDTGQPSLEEDDALDLFPEWLQAQTPDLTATRYDGDPIVRCAFVLPGTVWRWYVIEAGATEDLAGGQDVLFFGFVAGAEDELGYFMLSELTQLRGAAGLPVERDIVFTPQPLSQLIR